MRGLAFVLTIAFVFAASPLVLSRAVGQSGSSAVLYGQVCADSGSGPYANASQYGACYGQQGLPDARVWLTKPGPVSALPGTGAVNRSATTDGGGQFYFDGLASGDYTLTAARAGFETASVAVTVSSGKTQKDLVLQPKTIAVSGIVTDSSTGQAVDGAYVTLCCSPAGGFSASSGSDGRYGIKLPAGWYSFSVSRSGFQDFSDYRLFDGASDEDARLQPVPSQDARLHGTVRDQHGSPVADAQVYVSSYGGCCYAYSSTGTTTSSAYSGTSNDCGSCGASAPSSSYMRPYYGGGSNSTTTDAQGRYDLHVYGGSNSLSVGKEGYAGVSLQVDVPQGGDVRQDVTLQKFPPKNAHLEGRVTDLKTGKGLGLVSISVQSPEFGLYECSADSQDQRSMSPTPQPMPSTSGSAEGKMAPSPGPTYNGCAITVDSDGHYRGDVTPGYAIVQVVFEQWKSCSDSTDADGSSTHTCGPEYNTWSRSLVLAENATTTLDVPLHPRPAPDAVVSGYLVDAESGKAIPGAQISFSNEDANGYGYATTDQDGSYKLRLRSGYHQVYASAPSHLHWQGTLDVPKGDTPFDVQLTPGMESNGGCCCCPYYGGPVAYAMAEDKAAGAPAPSYTMSSTMAPPAGGVGMAASGGSGSNGGSGGSDQYQDLHGGLGPYDAAARAHALANSSPSVQPSHKSPALGPALVVAALAALLVARRRLAP